METPRPEHTKQYKGLNIKFGHPSIPNTPPSGSEEWTPLEEINEPLAQLYTMQYKIATIARAENEKLKSRFELQHIPEIDERTNPPNNIASPNTSSNEPETRNFSPGIGSSTPNNFLNVSHSNTSSPKVRPVNYEQRRRSVLSDDSNITCVEDSWDEDGSSPSEPSNTSYGSLSSNHKNHNNSSSSSSSNRHRYHMRSSSLGSTGDLSDLFMHPSPRTRYNSPMQNNGTDDPNLRDASRQLLKSTFTFLQALRRKMGKYGIGILASGVILLLAYLYGKVGDPPETTITICELS